MMARWILKFYLMLWILLSYLSFYRGTDWPSVSDVV